ISDMRAASLSLEEIRSLLELKEKSDTGQEAAESAVTALDAQIATIKEKIEVFTRLQSELLQARELLDKCRDCTNDRCFPDACDECTVMKDASVPQSMRVLWALK
ncbi:MAG TPA: hypothetical protein ENK57_25500, partial [Polyangiaceae bacterium]|nr:hypothetical protein [Polyangiaceae bacterium]